MNQYYTLYGFISRLNMVTYSYSLELPRFYNTVFGGKSPWLDWVNRPLRRSQQSADSECERAPCVSHTWDFDQNLCKNRIWQKSGDLAQVARDNFEFFWRGLVLAVAHPCKKYVCVCVCVSVPVCVCVCAYVAPRQVKCCLAAWGKIVLLAWKVVLSIKE